MLTKHSEVEIKIIHTVTVYMKYLKNKLQTIEQASNSQPSSILLISLLTLSKGSWGLLLSVRLDQ